MSKLRKSAVTAGGAAALFAALLAANIRRAGPRLPDGRSRAEILGKSPEEATGEDLKRLSLKDAMQLFHASRAPRLEEMHGEYRVVPLPARSPAHPVALFIKGVLPGRRPSLAVAWQAMTFQPGPMNEGEGHHVFLDRRKGERFRSRRTLNWVSPTFIGADMSESLHVDHSAFERGLARGLHLEVRTVNPDLFICAGFLWFCGGPRNPYPFVLVGPPNDSVEPEA